MLRLSTHPGFLSRFSEDETRRLLAEKDKKIDQLQNALDLLLDMIQEDVGRTDA